MPLEAGAELRCLSCGGEIASLAEGCSSCRTLTNAGLPPAAADPVPRPRGSYTGPKEIGGYTILRELGAGGMGAVFEAFEQKMNRRVALKVLSRHLSGSENAGDRFAREAWIAGKLSHPNLVKVFERGEESEIAFYSMELVEGGSLHDVIKNLRAWGKDERWGLAFGTREYLAWALTRIVETARGLDHAHRQGVVHRDIKPMNILLSREPVTVKVADFGLAVDLGATRMTTEGRVMGTVAYMAPEQIRGRQDLVDARTDVYSLGVTLFELLTLQLPFAGETQQIYLNAVLTTEARRPRKLNERVGHDLETVLRKSLEKERDDRYAGAGAFADDLENVLHFRPILARPPGRAARVAKWARRRPLHATLAGVLAVGLPVTAVLGVQALQHRRLVASLEIETWRSESSRLLDDNRYRDALEPLQRILSRQPRDVDALQRRSLTWFRLARAEKDASKVEDLRRSSLADIDTVVGLLPRTRWPYRVRAFLKRDFGDEAGAARDEASASLYASRVPEDIEFQIDGVLATIAKDYPKAIEEYGELIRRRPDSPYARQLRAEAYESVGDASKAALDYEVAAALKPSDVLSRLRLARLQTRQGALGDAEGIYRRVLEMQPENGQAHEGLAANLVEQGKTAASGGDATRAAELLRLGESEAREAVKRDPSLPWAWLNLGVALVEQSRLLPQPDVPRVEEALGFFRKTIELSSGNGVAGEGEGVTALSDQCDALILIRSLQQALDVCRRVVDLQPEDAASSYNLAAVHALSGRSDEAIVWLRKDLDLGDRDWQYLAGDRWFESLRSDARFKELLGRMRAAPPAQ